MNFSMNNELIITYDEKTTKWLDQAEKILEDYQKILWEKISNLDDDSTKSKLIYFTEDPVRKALIDEIIKIKSISIPVSMKIFDFDNKK